MLWIRLPFSGFIASLALLGCQQSGSRNCNTTQSQLSDSTLVRDIEPMAPAGGFIQFGSSACTVTLSLDEAREKELVVSAFTAHHCAREDSSKDPEVSLSVYLPAMDSKNSGYLKNIPVKDDFFERRKAFLSEIEKLKVPAASEFATQATMVPLLTTTYYNESLDDGEAASVFSYCLDKSTTRLNVPNSQQICWSMLDSSVRKLTIQASSLGELKFNQLKRYLEKRKANHSRALTQVKQLAADFTTWTTRVGGIQGGNRLHKYGQFAMFLNENVCKSLAKDDPKYPVCSVRDQLIELSDKYLVEVDIDGKSKSILKKLDELGIGSNSTFFRTKKIPAAGGSQQTVNYDIRDTFRDMVTSRLIEKMNENRTSLGELFSVNSQKILPFGRHYTIASNPVYTDPSSGTKRVLFSLIRANALFGSGDSLPAIPLSGSGGLRMYLTKNQSKLLFNPTDSGSMITFGGIVPLLVLHTVDDNPVSGGASILVLPEATSEEFPSAVNSKTSSRSPTIVSRTKTAEINTGVELSNSDVMVGQSDYLSVCN